MAKEPNDALWKLGLAVSLRNSGEAYVLEGDNHSALGRFQASLALFEEIRNGQKDSNNYRYELAHLYRSLGALYEGDSMLDEALHFFSESKNLDDALVIADDPNKTYQLNVSEDNFAIGRVYEKLSKSEDALSKYEESISILERQLIKDPDNFDLTYSLAIRHGAAGRVLQGTDLTEKAMMQFTAMRSLLDGLSKSYPSDQNVELALFEANISVGDSFRYSAEYDLAIVAYKAAYSVAIKFTNGIHDLEKWQFRALSAQQLLGALLIASGDDKGAIDYVKNCISFGEDVVRKHPSNPDMAHVLMVCYISYGDALFRLDDLAGAKRQALVAVSKANDVNIKFGSRTSLGDLVRATALLQKIGFAQSKSGVRQFESAPQGK